MIVFAAAALAVIAGLCLLVLRYCRSLKSEAAYEEDWEPYPCLTIRLIAEERRSDDAEAQQDITF